MKEMQGQAFQMLEMEACKTYKTCKLCAKGFIHEQVVSFT
jgi:hypothetical protein